MAHQHGGLRHRVVEQDVDLAAAVAGGGPLEGDVAAVGAHRGAAAVGDRREGGGVGGVQRDRVVVERRHVTDEEVLPQVEVGETRDEVGRLAEEDDAGAPGGDGRRVGVAVAEGGERGRGVAHHRGLAGDAVEQIDAQGMAGLARDPAGAGEDHPPAVGADPRGVGADRQVGRGPAHRDGGAGDPVVDHRRRIDHAGDLVEEQESEVAAVGAECVGALEEIRGRAHAGHQDGGAGRAVAEPQLGALAESDDLAVGADVRRRRRSDEREGAGGAIVEDGAEARDLAGQEVGRAAQEDDVAAIGTHPRSAGAVRGPVERRAGEVADQAGRAVRPVVEVDGAVPSGVRIRDEVPGVAAIGDIAAVRADRQIPEKGSLPERGGHQGGGIAHPVVEQHVLVQGRREAARLLAGREIGGGAAEDDPTAVGADHGLGRLLVAGGGGLPLGVADERHGAGREVRQEDVLAGIVG